MYIIETTDEFDEWFANQSETMQDKIMASMVLLQQYGHRLSQYGSKFNNIKELRIQIGGDPYRTFYAFDPILYVKRLCYVQATKWAMKSNFINK